MLRHCLAGSLLFASLLIGCQSQPADQDSAQASHPLTEAQFNRIRDAYQKEDPNVRVGWVEGVDTKNMEAAVGHVNVADFRKDDTISFLDSAEHTVAEGLVDNIANNFVLVHYQTPAGGRAPQQGDIAIRAIK